MHSVKQLANTGVGGARGYIDTGRKKLASCSQKILTEVEILLARDTAKDVKDDVTKRQSHRRSSTSNPLSGRSTPPARSSRPQSAHQENHADVEKHLGRGAAEEHRRGAAVLDSSGGVLAPSVGEPQNHPWGLWPYRAGHLSSQPTWKFQWCNQTSQRSRSFFPLPPSEGEGLSNVVLEIRGTSIDPEKRMKAIDANQRNRQKKLNARFDDLHAELHDLVGHKKLRITGGAEEVERARQKRSEMTLKAMFNVNVSSPPHSSSDLSFSPLY